MRHSSHTFETYVGIEIAGGRYLAWVPKTHVMPNLSYRGYEVINLPEMLRCSCGEQGYAIPDLRVVPNLPEGADDE